ncbi:sulfatase-like hydrolase/transferase [candidate division KSB3 bacterium]|nr:sulfatase-like hydrolase/transferase [candidate division KSB3 bacterium]
MAHIHPNFIYVICHDLGKHLGCYGATGVPSPNLDRFAADGVKFNSAFCSAAACTPSRGCAMTGQYSHTNGLMGLVNFGWSLPQETKTVVDYLNEAGYETAHFGLQHERYAGWANRYQIEGNPYIEGDRRGHRRVLAERAITDAIAYLKERKGLDKPRPFYLNVGTVEVHASRWGGLVPGSPRNRESIYGAVPPERAFIPHYIPDVPQLRRVMGKFEGAIRYLDNQVQRLFDAVEDLGYSEDTLVIFTTDHGIANMRSKWWIYDRGVEIALIMRMPGTIGEGEVISDLIPNLDITPTILEAAGIEIPPAVQGRSFWKRLTGGNYDPHEAIFVERNYQTDYDPMRAIRTERFHYIRNFGENPKKAWLPDEVPYMNETYDRYFYELWPEPSLSRDEEELFDVEQDPDEFVNLAYNSRYRDTKSRLAAQLDQWMRDTDDPLLKGPIPDRLYGWPKAIMLQGGYAD